MKYCLLLVAKLYRERKGSYSKTRLIFALAGYKVQVTHSAKPIPKHPNRVFKSKVPSKDNRIWMTTKPSLKSVRCWNSLTFLQCIEQANVYHVWFLEPSNTRRAIFYFAVGNFGIGACSLMPADISIHRFLLPNLFPFPVLNQLCGLPVVSQLHFEIQYRKLVFGFTKKFYSIGISIRNMIHM